MSDESAVQVNFGRPMPVFPLDTVTLLPQQILPLHIFEERYRQMVAHSLDGAGQIAMAMFEGADWTEQYHGTPPIRPAVCIGQIVEHQHLPDDRYNLLLQGVCRARIIEEHAPDHERLYREAILEPVGIQPGTGTHRDAFRAWLDGALEGSSLAEMTASAAVLEYARNTEIPTEALLEVVSFTMLNDSETRYHLLEEGDPDVRADYIRSQLDDLRTLIDTARRQHPETWPKGCAWN
ncbi:MAG: LON peptidase substrate-binding domain-containing protein [Phycisphaerales bacterium]|nr:LON peptidase substrate-binding domain-containing protein [Phycisphaerales bacterium]